MNEDRYTLWVDSSKVNNYYLTLIEAEELADEYIEDGYGDVQIEKITGERILANSCYSA